LPQFFFRKKSNLPPSRTSTRTQPRNQNLCHLSQNIQRKTKRGISFELHKLKIKGESGSPGFENIVVGTFSKLCYFIVTLYINVSKLWSRFLI